MRVRGFILRLWVWWLCLGWIFLSSCVVDRTKWEGGGGEDRKLGQREERGGVSHPAGGLDEGNIVAILDGERVSLEEYKNYLYGVIGKKFLEAFLTEKLVFRRAEELGIRVGEEELKGWVDRQLAEQIGRYGSRDRFLQELKKKGLTLEKYLEEVERNAPLMVRIEKMVRRERISEGNLRREYEKRFGRKAVLEQIFFSFYEAERKEADRLARKRAELVLEKIRKRELTFGEAVKFYSESPTSSKGGSLGYQPLGNLPEPTRKFIEKLGVGEVSDVHRTPVGYHIFLLKDRRGRYVHLLHIAITSNPKYRLDVSLRRRVRRRVKEEAFRVYRRIKMGELTFEEALAKSGQREGKRLEFRRHQSIYGEDFETRVFALKVGEVSAPILTDVGYHILRLEALKPPLRPFDEGCRRDLVDILQKEEVTVSQMKRWTERLRRRARITIK